MTVETPPMVFVFRHDVADHQPPLAIHFYDDLPRAIVDAAECVGERGLPRRSGHDWHVNAVELAGGL